MRANFTPAAFFAQRPSTFVVTKIQLFKVVQASDLAFQRNPRTSLPHFPPAGLVTIMRNHGVNSSVSRLFPKPTGADTLHAVGTFQQDNLVKDLINRWQTPDAFIGAIQAVNDRRPISLLQSFWQPSLWGLQVRQSDAFRFVGPLAVQSSVTSNCRSCRHCLTASDFPFPEKKISLSCISSKMYSTAVSTAW